MTQSHIGQILPLKNQSMPISKNTVFHASYKNKLYGLNQGVKVEPLGYQSALNFPGTTAYIKTPIPYFTGTTGVSFAGWIKTNVTTGEIGIMGCTESASWGVQRLTVYLGKVRAVFGTGAQVTSEINGTSVVGDGKWHFIVGTHSPAFNKIYVDGVLESTLASSNLANASDVLYLGTYSLAAGFFIGGLSCCSIWNKELTPVEISSMMMKEPSGEEANLVGYWKMNEGSGAIAHDSSLRNNDCVITNGTWVEGRTIASMRSNTKFENAVAVESPTTNLVVNPILVDSNSDGIADSFSVGAAGAGDPARVFSNVIKPGVNTIGNIQHVEILSMGTTDASYIIQVIQGISAGTTYTFSAYMKSSTADKGYIQIRWRDSAGTNIGSDVTGSSVSQANVFERMTLTAVAPVGATQLNYYIRGFGNAVGTWLEIEGVQLEQKAFATSFVNGSRSKCRLVYPNPLVGVGVGTITFWANFPNMTTVLGNQVWLSDYNGATSTPWFGLDNNAGAYALSNFGNISATPYHDSWHMYTLTKDVGDTTGRAYIDGLYVGAVTGAANMFKSPTFAIGSFPNGDYTSNLLVEDFRIDSVVVTEDEILAWYQSNAPFYNYLDYSGEA